jgi:hypothetical protein
MQLIANADENLILVEIGNIFVLHNTNQITLVENSGVLGIATFPVAKLKRVTICDRTSDFDSIGFI